MSASTQEPMSSPAPGSKPTPKRLNQAKTTPGRSVLDHLSLRSLSLSQAALLCLSFVLVLHLGALLLFTRGFLLNRTTLDKRNNCDLASDDCTLPAKFDRAVIVLVDALRFDFLFPVDPASPDFDASHHNHLTTPIRLSRDSPSHSLLYKAVADPPTTTLQRLKAITTGSLPTFIDAGSNFAGSRVEEDNWLEQANRAGKRIAFMGDDTWLTIFPESIFAPNLSFPFDSFNVEDLDTVDAGVNHHILPLLDEDASSSSWDILFAHPLGLDHAGHRFGASHSETTRKLKEVNVLLSKIVARLAEKDLLIVLGDHGMDAKGDHGGDSPEETDAGMWLYSKTPLVPAAELQSKPFASSEATLEDLLNRAIDNGETTEFFALDGKLHRSVPQISLVPTLSLLLGLAVPLNNLGTIIPELFLDSTATSWLSRTAHGAGDRLLQALRINSLQLKSYLEAYAAHSGGTDLAPYVPQLLDAHAVATASKDSEQAFLLYRQFTYATLRITRGIWARFDPVSMAAGLLVLAGSLATIWRLYRLAQTDGPLWKTGLLRQALSRGTIGLLAGIPVGTVIAASAILFRLEFLPFSRVVTAASCLGAEVAVLSMPSARFPANPLGSKAEVWLGRLLLGSHVAIFASNSYILWEDWVTLFLVQLSPLLLLVKSWKAPQERLRWRIAGFSVLAMALNRVIAISSICREEQHPYCTATFYGSSGVSIASPSAIIAAVLAAVVLPFVLGRFLSLSRSYEGWAPFFLMSSFRGLLVGGALYWGADYLEHASQGGEHSSASATFKFITARILLLFGILLATTFWSAAPLCIDVQTKQVPDQTGELKSQVTVLGFANSVGSSYLLVLLPLFGMVFLVAQPIGQVVLAAGLVSLLAYLEANDSARDAVLLQKAFEQASTDDGAQLEMPTTLPPPGFLSIATLVLSGFLLFFSTGHQAVLSAIQWKTAFVGFPTLTYPFSPLLVLLNTLGPFIISALAVPLLVFWNVTPTLRSGPTIPLLSNLLCACLGFLLYHTAITLSSAIFASYLRRHLMVWKVFAPRFMLSAMTLVAVDLTLLVVAVGWGGLGTLRKLHKTFGTAWS